MKREIKFSDLSANIQTLLISALIFSIFALYLLMLSHYNLQSQIDSLPKKVCHNETIANDFLTNKSIIVSNAQNIPATVTFNLKPYQIAIIKQKEVCEIK